MENENKYYSKTFYEKHPDKLTKTETCDLCGGKYKYCNKSHHRSTKKHKMVEKIIKEYTTKSNI